MFLRADSHAAEFRRGHARYMPTARLAAGGMAEVWRGRAEFADGHVAAVAIKRVLPMLAGNILYRRMLEDEARIGMLLRHHNIVRVFDAREVRGSFILIMELVDGPSLRDLLSGLVKRGVSPSVRVSLHIAAELARALTHAHEAIDEWGRDLCIIHRDVSPHNVLVSNDGSVKLMDFGLANSSANLAERDPGMIGGKFGYVSPELVLRQEASPSLDLFALGVVLWECLAGRRLFQGKDDGETVRNVARCQVPPPSSVNAEVPAVLDEVLAVLLCADPAERYASARELLADLEYVMQQLGPGDAVAETAALVKSVRSVPPSVARPSSAQTGSFSRSHGGHTRSPVSTSGTRVATSAVSLLTDLEVLADAERDALPVPGAKP